jgi:hypothetical protein
VSGRLGSTWIDNARLRHTDCAASHGNYSAKNSSNEYLYWDTDGSCAQNSITQGDWNIASTAIESICGAPAQPALGDEGADESENGRHSDDGPCDTYSQCRDISDWLWNLPTVKEWTGVYADDHWWDAYQLGDLVAFHWDAIPDVGLWAHEGAHGALNITDEYEADLWRSRCQGQINY